MPRPSTPYTHNGKTQFLADWARDTGIPRRVLYKRVKLMGWDISKAIEAPIRVASADERFLRAVTFEPNTGCWIWTGTLNNAGYGLLGVDGGKRVLAHRFSYEKFKGQIPNGLVVMHVCDQRYCCNPDHLAVGSHQDNAADTIAKGRHAREKPNLRGEIHPQAKLTNDEAELVMQSSESAASLARRFGVSDTAVLAIRNGKNWRHLTTLLGLRYKF